MCICRLKNAARSPDPTRWHWQAWRHTRRRQVALWQVWFGTKPCPIAIGSSSPRPPLPNEEIWPGACASQECRWIGIARPSAGPVIQPAFARALLALGRTHARTGTGTAPPGDRPPLFGAKTSTGLSNSKAAGARRVADAPRGSRRVL